MSALDKFRKSDGTIDVAALKNSWFSYATPERGSFDHDFVNKCESLGQMYARKLRPLDESKKILLEMAERGSPRPSQKSPNPEERRLSLVLTKLLARDSELRQRVGVIRPEWLGSPRKRDKSGKMEALETLYKTGCTPKKGHPLYHSHYSYRQSQAKWFGKMMKMYPDTLASPEDKSLGEFLKKIPTGVSMVPNQEWKGIQNKYEFVCRRYGQFSATPATLAYSAWPRGNSGHPEFGRKNRKERIKSKKGKPVINLDTKQTFPSAKSAAQSFDCSTSQMNRALNQNKLCGGHRWAYSDKAEG